MRRTVCTLPVWVIILLLPAGILHAQNIPVLFTHAFTAQTSSSQPVITPSEIKDGKKLRIAASAGKKEKYNFQIPSAFNNSRRPVSTRNKINPTV